MPWPERPGTSTPRRGWVYSPPARWSDPRPVPSAVEEELAALTAAERFSAIASIRG